MFTINDHITSNQNPRIRNFQHLLKARERRHQGVFVLEGILEIGKAAAAGYHFKSVFFCPDIISAKAVEELIDENHQEVFSVSTEIFEKIAYRENSGGIVILAESQEHKLENLKLKEQPLLIVLEAVEKPGNLGAILRTADAAAVDAVIICDPQTDLYNPNVVRSSIGCLFSVPVAVAGSAEVINWLGMKKISIYCTALTASVPYHTINFKMSSAIVLGTEATGITKTWLDASDNNIIIPMLGQADSLNVSTAAAIVVFEARRQRGF
jgi:TrmH family RNA methyltransferase